MRRLVSYVAGDKAEEDEALSHVLSDILDTPVSPELLPAIEGQIARRPRIWWPLRATRLLPLLCHPLGLPATKVLRLAEHAFGRTYPRAVVLQWLRTFYRRFFAQQFKRSCLPDGPRWARSASLPGATGACPPTPWRPVAGGAGGAGGLE